ncbi:hypothetical protein BDV96DRAFT_639732 [Lophiotrema nucula]|uniref:F-box domain-containing protein n=1 Tax=Lophiotrema nucula TaxID=690887 RepID=A0A6A5ZUL3_9PLEO|nr:hypothetical protein BDV96DRAFT_639732 [Lophiotrema nucula]
MGGYTGFSTRIVPSWTQPVLPSPAEVKRQLLAAYQRKQDAAPTPKRPRKSTNLVAKRPRPSRSTSGRKNTMKKDGATTIGAHEDRLHSGAGQVLSIPSPELSPCESRDKPKMEEECLKEQDASRIPNDSRLERHQSTEFKYLPTELRHMILKYIVWVFVGGNYIDIMTLISLPEVMRTCRQIRSDTMHLLAQIPLCLPYPVRDRPDLKIQRQIANFKTIYGASPRYLIMRVPIIQYFEYSTPEELKRELRSVIRTYGVDEKAKLLTGIIVGQSPPTGSGNCIASITHYETALTRGATRRDKWITKIFLYSQLQIFNWWTLLSISSVDDTLTFELKGFTDWQMLNLTHDWRDEILTQQCAIASFLASVIAFDPNVPNIKVTGLGAFLNIFLKAWNGIPQEIAAWQEYLKTRDGFLLCLLVSWPFPESFIKWEMVFDDPSEAHARYQACDRDLLDLKDLSTQDWAKRVWRARFSRHQWQFVD